MARGVSKRLGVEGSEEFRRALKRLGNDAGDFLKVNREIARIVEAAARRRAPVRTGRLQRSITGKATKTKAYVQAGNNRKPPKRAKTVGTAVPYAGPIHFGWPRRNIAPQPFLYSALDERRSEVIEVHKKRMDALIRRLDRETPG